MHHLEQIGYCTSARLAQSDTRVPRTNGNMASVVTPDASPPASAARTSSFPGRAFRRGGPARAG